MFTTQFLVSPFLHKSIKAEHREDEVKSLDNCLTNTPFRLSMFSSLSDTRDNWLLRLKTAHDVTTIHLERREALGNAMAMDDDLK
ncbi:hypothetical protein Bpfe_009428 [Biomphalaria pfeifferi]|uniref:Uncharacterized protein n=1 Tax=Biomphalaria pfeifferi TaxID=112525 RepID=A0AAD8BWC5_BIOPF|nr:hypothetical protein Bpfe_009428 [Biomphalaria pfeifferi]